MNRRHLLSTLLSTSAALGIGAGYGGAAHAQAFPSKSITLVVPFSAGGPTDRVARVLGEKLQEALGKPVVIDNKPGAGGQIAAQQIKQAPADGHTVFVGATEMFAINPTLYKKFSYDPFKDLLPVTTLAAMPMLLVVPPTSPVNSVADLVAAAKSKPKGVAFASQGTGSIGHLLGEMFHTKVGGNFVHIAYKGSAPALQDLMGGQVDMMFDVEPTSGPLVKTGKLKALAVAAPKRMPTLPDVKTMAEAGFPGMDAGVWFAAAVKAGTPPEVVARLNEALVGVLKRPDVVKSFAEQGMATAPRSAAEFGSFMKSEAERWSALVKSSGATVD